MLFFVKNDLQGIKDIRKCSASNEIFLGNARAHSAFTNTVRCYLLFFPQSLKVIETFIVLVEI